MIAEIMSERFDKRKMKKTNYQGVSLPKKLLDFVEERVNEGPFTSKADYLRYLLRREMQKRKSF